MLYRIVTTNDAGEERVIEYNSRRAAYNHFASTAHSRHLSRIRLEKYDDAEEVWTEEATMEVTRNARPAQPQPQPEQAAPHRNIPDLGAGAQF